jgi:two-component system, NtrC family, sensor histidine kinase HydH
MRETATMRWQRGATLLALLLAWTMLAMWQWQEYQAECQAARDSLRRQAESVMNTLVGGVQSHRRLGFFLEEQLQGVLDELGKSQDILAAAVVSADRRLTLSAGRADLLNLSSPVEPGHSWEPAGFRDVAAFQLSPEPPRPGGMGPGPGGMGPGPGGMGPGHGPMGLGPPGAGFGGGGRGGRGRSEPGGPPELPPNRPKNSWAAGGRCYAVLLLDRALTDQQITHYGWLRGMVVIAGGLVILSVALAWRATMRLADAHGRARMFEIEARHLRELSQAAAGLAHETRNPLGLIRGWTQRLAQSLPESPQQRQQAQAVIEECDRVTARINQFLAFARPCQPRLSSVRPAEVATELVALLNPDLDAKRLQLVSSFAAPDQTIQADREMFRQALFNLLQNAIEFSPEGATVEIGATIGQDGAMRIEVSDRGPGVPAEAVERLFTPYHTTRSSGTGLGLAIVHRIAAVHGWEVGYAPRPGGGSIFWLETNCRSRPRETSSGEGRPY